MTVSSTTIVGAKSEFLTNFGNDWLAAKAKEDRNIAFAKRDGKSVVRLVEVNSDLFEYPDFDPANLTRQNTRNSSRGDTRYYDKERPMIPASIGEEYRFGARWTDSDLANQGKTLEQMQNAKTIEAMQQTGLDYNIRLAAAFNSAGINQQAAAALWTATTGDPVADFQAQFQAFYEQSLGLFVTDIIIPMASLRQLKINDAFRGYVKGTVNSGRMSNEDVEGALSDIQGAPVRVHLSAQAYNAALPDNAKTITVAEAWTATTCYLFRRGEDGVQEDVSGVTQFYIPAQEGIYYNDADPDNDNSRNLKTVVSKLKRKPIVTAPRAVRRLINCVA